MPIKKGDVIQVEYKGYLEDGTVFDSSEKHGQPLEFEVGCGQMIPGFENAVMGMEEGDEKEFKLAPSDAYGQYDPHLIKKVSRTEIPDNVQADAVLLVQFENGMQIPVKVVEITEEEVSLDLNHPLAGENLTFKIKIVNIAS